MIPISLRFQGHGWPFVGTHEIQLPPETRCGQGVRFQKAGGGYCLFLLGRGFLEYQGETEAGEVPHEGQVWLTSHLPVTISLN